MSTAISLATRRWTAAEYHQMGEAGILAPDERVELLDGEIIQMTPIGPAHASIVNLLDRRLQAVVQDRAIVSTQNPILLDSHSEPQPDIALLRLCEDWYRQALPTTKDILLVIEVADSSVEYDRKEKIPQYARHAIADVWLVDVSQESLTIFSKPTLGSYASVRIVQDLAHVPLPFFELAVDLTSIF
jgi:Uma2 family endonuclease